MPTILAIETSTELASVALLREGQVISRSSADVATHSQAVLPLVQQLLADAGLSIGQCDALAFGCGPGSFTGVRTACGIIQGLAFGAQLPVISVSTLMAMALACHERDGATDIVAVLDARMEEVYWAQYRLEGDWHEIMPPALSSPALVGPSGDIARLAACGNGLALMQRAGVAKSAEVIAGAVVDRVPNGAGSAGSRSRGEPAFAASHADIMPHATQIARLAALAYARGELLHARDAQPVYLRNQVALTTAQRTLAQAERSSAQANAIMAAS